MKAKFPKNRTLFSLLIFFVSIALPYPVAASNRSETILGVWGSLLGNPSPSFWGINLGMNLSGWIRPYATYGAITQNALTASSVGGGIRAYVPGWSFSPMVGMELVWVSADSTGTVGGFTFSTSSSSILHTSIQFGLEWQMQNGLLIGGGAQYSLSSRKSESINPYINLGWFL